MQAVFPEGGLSRDGALRPPKLGLLSYMVSNFDPNGARDIVFVPVGVNYDRVLEDRILTSGELEDIEKAKTYRFRPGVLLRYVGHSIWLALRGKWHRFGYTCVSFGTPLSMRTHLQENNIDFRAMGADQKYHEIERLGEHLMKEVGRVVPALPVSLVAYVMQETDIEAPTVFELKGLVHDLVEQLEEAGAYVHIPRADRDYALDVGVRMLVMRGLVIEEDGHYRINPEERVLIRYYANAIAHLVKEPVNAAVR